ncbi:hypothetical protein NJB1907E78_14580 [Mycobacterium marinum]|nr:hypothetical protein KST_02863 [Mycobacterium marinum]GJO03153.1 hypothetical protein NJB1907f34b_22680 [Mycobacterium marinum]GJO08503.1 hypothetical protein NJB1907E90_23300 [Mycobacterium marinum]GJO08829.1 hypothetical protein NJB1808e29_41820 [Mycobacterium marinum]GJO13774.1 hypothetical protein NJB1907E11_09560 [Mycobacterium marinum]
MNTDIGSTADTGDTNSGFNNTGSNVSGFFNTATGTFAGDISGMFNQASGGTVNGIISGIGNTGVADSLPGIAGNLTGLFNTGSNMSGVFSLEELLKQLAG